MGRLLARTEAADAAEALGQSLGAGVLGAEQRVVDTMTAFSANAGGFDEVAKAYEEATEAPLRPALDAVPDAAARVPRGWYPGISD